MTTCSPRGAFRGGCSASGGGARVGAGGGPARGGGAVGLVEAEAARLRLLVRRSVEGAAVVLAVALLLEPAGVGGRHDHDALADPGGGLHGVGPGSARGG